MLPEVILLCGVVIFPVLHTRISRRTSRHQQMHLCVHTPQCVPDLPLSCASALLAAHLVASICPYEMSKMSAGVDGIALSLQRPTNFSRGRSLQLPSLMQLQGGAAECKAAKDAGRRRAHRLASLSFLDANAMCEVLFAAGLAVVLALQAAASLHCREGQQGPSCKLMRRQRQPWALGHQFMGRCAAGMQPATTCRRACLGVRTRRLHPGSAGSCGPA